MRVVIIGATGHIGTWLVPRLVRAGHEVVAVTRGARRPYHAAPEWQQVERVTLDRAAEESAGTFGRRIAALRGEAIIDLICFTLESASHLVDALRGRVRHFVHCGTLWVHGVPDVRPYDETAAREPFGDYGVRKAAVERYLMDEARGGFPATVLHPGHISGPGWAPINPAGHLDTRVFDTLAAGELLTLPDDGAATLQHVHADDVAQAFECAVRNPAAAIGEAFHVAAAEPVTLRAYAEAAAQWFGREARLAYLPWTQWRVTVSERDAALTWDHVRHSPCASIEKIRRVLGFAPRFSAVDAARDAVAALYPDRLQPSGA
ncbi:MAG: NAD-dependent epimerase/dehydratase family protein [Gemmatimonadetes bacterium]|nr:NAD-dependent epimerase/dehydratase family protein [Gemmatimonadota bacterium]